MTTVRAAQREAASILERELFKPSGIQADCVRIATHNVVTLTGNLPAVLDEALTHEIDVLCVQETRHTSQTEGTIRMLAKDAGWDVVFGEPCVSASGAPINGVAIFSRWPCEHMELHGLGDENPRDRQRAVGMHLYRPEAPTLKLVAIYLDASDASEADRVGSRVIDCMMKIGGDKLLIGDFNRTPLQQPAARVLASGAWHLADGCVEQDLCTRKNGRWIDFGVHSFNVDIKARSQWDGRGDHDIIAYDVFTGKPPPTKSFAPTATMRKTGDTISTEDWEYEFGIVQNRFRLGVEANDLEVAWRTLSGVAEKMLREEDSLGGRPRDRAPRPTWNAEDRKRGKSLESIMVRRLLRVERRIKEAQRIDGPVPHGLEENIHKALDGLVARFPVLTDVDFLDPDALTTMGELIADTRAKDDERRLRAWKERLEDNENAMLAWIKKEPLDAPATDSGKPLHPQERVEHEAAAYKELWNPKVVPNVSELDPILDWTANFRSEVEVPILTGAELKRICHGNADKAAGVDQWYPRHWTLLPIGFFDQLAAMWNAILHQGARLPEAWLDVKVALIPKEEPGEKRPISIAVAAWRLGISAIVARLKAWILSWVPAEVIGGIPGRSPEELHEELQESIWEHLAADSAFAGCKVDLKKCFDKANANQSLRILEKLGLPEQIGDVFRCFYDNHRKWFQMDGCVAGEAVCVTNGLLQGCPASMLLLAAQAATWVMNVKEKEPRVQIGVYVDDRALTAGGEDAVEVLINATKAGDRVDAILGHEKHPNKISSFGRGKKIKKKLHGASSILGKNQQRFVLLGVSYSVEKRKLCQKALKTDLKLRRRIQRIPLATKSFWTRKRFVKKLVLPLVSYTGAWTTPSKTMLASWSSLIEHALVGKPILGRSRYLVWAATLGSDVCPRFALDREALRHEIWRIRRQNQRKLENLLPVRHRFAGRWSTVAEKWGWTLVDGTSDCYCTPDGVVQLGADGKPAINAVAARGWERELWQYDSRTNEELSDQVSDFSRPCIATHAAWSHDALCNGGGRRRLKAAVGAAFDSKVAAKMAAKVSVGFSPTCDCGYLFPDRAHWMWFCPTRIAGRVGSAPPYLSMLKLAVPRVPLVRKARLPSLPTERIADLARSLQVIASTGVKPIVATDGGSKGESVWTRCAAFGAATGHTRIGGRLQGLDHSAYAAELWGALVALTSAAQAGVDITLIIDNQAVQKRIWQAIRGRRQLPTYFSTTWRRIFELLDRIPGTECFWVPAHDRHEEWRPPAGHDKATWRELNDYADLEASAASSRLWEELTSERNANDANARIAHVALLRVLDGSEQLRQAFSLAMVEDPERRM